MNYFTTAVLAGTLVTLIVGVLLGEICLDVSRHRGCGKRLRRWTEAIDKKVFG